MDQQRHHRQAARRHRAQPVPGTAFPGRRPARTFSAWCRETREFCDGEGIEAIPESPAGIVGFSLSHLPSMLAMETSRGCWWGAKHRCTFCGLNQMDMEFRSKSPERALAAQARSRAIREALDSLLLT